MHSWCDSLPEQLIVSMLLQLQWVPSEGSAYPILKIEIGEATLQCQGSELIDFAEAIISQVELAMHSKFSDRDGCPEQMIVVARCAGASPLQVAALPLSLLTRPTFQHS